MSHTRATVPFTVLGTEELIYYINRDLSYLSLYNTFRL